MKEEMKEICVYFSKQGGCKFGDSCYFQHVITPPPTHNTTHTTHTTRHDREEKKICQFYMKTGTCRFGSTCRFQHINHALEHRRKPKITDKTMKCRDYFSVLNDQGKPIGDCKYNDYCKYRHYYTTEEEYEVLGWSKIHDAVFHGDYTELAELLPTGATDEEYNTLFSKKTTLPYVIRWSEYDSVDHTHDNYKITIPVGSTVMDVAETSKKDLDKDSPCSIAVVDYLLDSVDGRDHREICIKILQYPTRLKEILEYVDKGKSIRRWVA